MDATTTLAPVIVIGYHEETNAAIDGTVITAATDERDAIAKALAWVQFDASDEIGGWRAFEYSESWAPGREIKPTDKDYS